MQQLLEPTVALVNGRANRDGWLAANHCGRTSQAIDPSLCVSYDGCDSAYPVEWCEFDGVHEVKSFVTMGAWSFFLQFLQ